MRFFSFFFSSSFFIYCVFLCSLAGFSIYELGSQGWLKNSFLRSTFYPSLSRFVNAATDLKFKIRGNQSVKNKIVVVHIDSPSLEMMGRWPWHRDVTALLIERLFELGSKVVGLDMTFSESDKRVPDFLKQLLEQKGLADQISTFETDEVLKKTIQKYHDKLVMSWISENSCNAAQDGKEQCPVNNPQWLSLWTENQKHFAISLEKQVFEQELSPLLSFILPIFNLDLFSQVASHSGFINGYVDEDGFIRKTPLLAAGGGSLYPSLSLKMAEVGLKDQINVTLGPLSSIEDLSFRNASRVVPVNRLGLLEINFRGKSNLFVSVPAMEVFSEEKYFTKGVVQKNIADMAKTDVFKDAFVLLGISAIGENDLRQFPFEPNSPGVYGHANALDNILSGDGFRQEHWKLSFWIVLGCMFFGMGIFWKVMERLSAVPGLGFVLVSILSVFGIENILFFHQINVHAVFLLIQMGLIFVITLSAKYIREENNKKFIKDAFSKYVSPAVVNEMLQDPKKLLLGGEKKELSIMFSDIRNFTTMSETMDSKKLATLLNEYLGKMSAIVFDHLGTVDKYIGDAVMAFWGAPLSMKEHAFYACKAAIAMQIVLKDQKSYFKSVYGVDLEVGIGINSGMVNVGNMGSDQNFSYTVIGDHVNLASRVEGLTKMYGAQILVTRNTFNCIIASQKALPQHRSLDFVKVKGKLVAVELLQIFPWEMPLEPLVLFTKAKALYAAQKWHEAIALFVQVQELFLKSAAYEDKASKLFIQRCQGFLAAPPEADWDGSWKMDSK